jgi:hypothetical protein
VFSAGDDALLQIHRRAARAAARGAASFPVPELLPVAAAIAADPRSVECAAAARRWSKSGAFYHDLVRLAARYVLELEAQAPAVESVYVPKASGELEPLLALWPHVLGLPVFDPIAETRMVTLRALPVHPLGVVGEASWADGRICSPAEYFFHDLDHARFKVRQDLAALGVEIQDAYRDGTTFDPESGRHRVILTAVRGDAAQRLWDSYGARSELGQLLLNNVARISDRALSEAALLLLFEVIHEKSFSLDRAVLERELSARAHTEKLKGKLERGFFGPHAPRTDLLPHLDAARLALLEALP